MKIMQQILLFINGCIGLLLIVGIISFGPIQTASASMMTYDISQTETQTMPNSGLQETGNMGATHSAACVSICIGTIVLAAIDILALDVYIRSAFPPAKENQLDEQNTPPAMKPPKHITIT